MEENGNVNKVIEGVTTTGEVRYGDVSLNASAEVYNPFENKSINENAVTQNAAETIAETVGDKESAKAALPTQFGFWSKVKSFLFQEITVELTPRQKKIEKEINEFLFQEITLFGKKKKKIG